MQNRKEDFIEFVKTIKNKVHDWWVSYNRKLWTTRIFVYGFLLLLVIFVGAVLFAKFNLFHTDADSARYMLSALVQSQAAIVAIVVSLTLIAVQLTASAYSPRVVDIFKKNPDMWILLGCYGVSIFYGFIVLKLVEGAGGEAVSQSAIWSLGWISISFESCVSLAYWLGAFTFVALFPYMWNIISLLKSEHIIKQLAIEITKPNLLNSKEYPILPIVDIIHGSIMKYDFETTRVGLKAITDQVLKIIGLDNKRSISERFCSYLRRVSRLAVSKIDEESSVEVVKNLLNFGKSTAEKGFESAAVQVAWSLEEVGRTAVEKGLESTASQAVMSLGTVGRTAVEKGLKSAASQAAKSLGRVGEAAAEKELEIATRRVAWSLGRVGRTALEKELKEVTVLAAMSLEEVGRTALEKELKEATSLVAWSLVELTILNEEIVKTAIRDYKSYLKEKDRDSFQKFMKIYEQKLEKLRAENRTQNKKTENR